MDNFKDVEINGRKWRVTKFDARTGSKIIKKLIPIVAAFLKGNDVKAVKPEDLKLNIGNVINALNEIKDEDFDYIQTACLKVSSEALGAGFTPVIGDNGTFAVIGIENDTMTVMALTAHALIFNVTGFFEGSPLASIAKGIFSTFQQNSKT